jgi:hypothetical protein
MTSCFLNRHQLNTQAGTALYILAYQSPAAACDLRQDVLQLIFKLANELNLLLELSTRVRMYYLQIRRQVCRILT